MKIADRIKPVHNQAAVTWLLRAVDTLITQTAHRSNHHLHGAAQCEARLLLLLLLFVVRPLFGAPAPRPEPVPAR